MAKHQEILVISGENTIFEFRNNRTAAFYTFYYHLFACIFKTHTHTRILNFFLRIINIIYLLNNLF